MTSRLWQRREFLLLIFKINKIRDTIFPNLTGDNHYQLLISTGGDFKLNIDFEEVEFNVPTILCIFPEQVHNTIEVINPKGWIINFDSSLVDKELGQLMENRMTTPIAFGHKINLYQHIVSEQNYYPYLLIKIKLLMPPF